LREGLHRLAAFVEKVKVPTAPPKSEEPVEGAAEALKVEDERKPAFSRA
jgi:hypothetical protein